MFDIAFEHHIFLLAAGIAFNILLYLIPLFLMAVYVIGLIYDVDVVLSSIIQGAKNILPIGMKSDDYVNAIVNEVKFILEKKNIAGIAGSITLLWLSSTLLSSIRAGLNEVYEIRSPKIFILYKLKDIFLSIVLAVLVLIISFVIPFISYIKAFLGDFLPSWLNGMFSFSLETAISLFISFILFFFMYHLIPSHKPSPRIALLSAIICSIFLEISRYIFSYYSSNFADYGAFYGAYAIIVSLAIWLFYLSFIILFSGEIAKFIIDKRTTL